MSHPTTEFATTCTDAGAEYALTLEGFKVLEAKLAALREMKGRDISERLRDARAFGEVSGNDEYLAIREDEAIIDARIATLEEVLVRASVVDGRSRARGIVTVGSKVTVMDRGTQSSHRYRVVGTHQQVGPGEVSAGSPVGRALLGRRRGESVTVELPDGRARELEIVATRLPSRS